MKKLNHVRDHMDAMIATHGWAVQAVFDPEGKEPSFTYTVGLSRSVLPELIVFGLPGRVAHQFLSHAREYMAEHGMPPLDTDMDEFAEGLPTRFVLVPREKADEFMFAALDRYPDYTAIQIVWPDEHGRFPWDAECDPAVKDAQPVLRAELH